VFRPDSEFKKGGDKKGQRGVPLGGPWLEKPQDSGKHSVTGRHLGKGEYGGVQKTPNLQEKGRINTVNKRRKSGQ